MTAAWREYQNSAAAVFRGLGFRAEVEAQIIGARGVHEIDVLVTGDFPVIYGETPDGDLQTADNWEELISRLTELVDSAEQFAAENESNSGKQ